MALPAARHLDHDDKIFTVVGILKPTRTPVDWFLWCHAEGIEAMHIDWKQGAPPLKGQKVPAERIKKEEIKIEQITAFFLRSSESSNPRAAWQINTFPEEPLMAVIPGGAERAVEWHQLRRTGVESCSFVRLRRPGGNVDGAYTRSTSGAERSLFSERWSRP
jgi:hypothetical protein